MSQPRTFTVAFDKTWFRAPLDWSLLISGPSVGGYGTLDRSRSRYATEAAAITAGEIWAETGITPAFQTPERLAAARAHTPQEIEA